MRRFLVIVAIATLAIGTIATPAPTCAADASSLLRVIRSVRGDGIPTGSAITIEAQSRAREIVTDFSHAGASHRYAEILAWNAYPENLTEAEAVSQWLNSPGHRAILLGQWAQIGVGVQDAGTKHFFVALFAPRAKSTPKSAPLLLPATDAADC